MTFFNRAAAASAQGVTPGLAMDVASTSDSEQSAANGAKPFSQMTRAERQAALAIEQEKVANSLNPNRAAEMAEGEARAMGDSKPFEAMQRYIYEPISYTFQGQLRATMDATRRGGIWGGARQAAMGFSPAAMLAGVLDRDSALRAGYDQASAAGASVSQTAWEIVRANMAPDGTRAGYWDAERRQMIYPLLDKPEEEAARLEYFGNGVAKWTTGVGDALFNLSTDPLNLVTAGGSAAIKSARGISLVDVAAASAATQERGVLAAARKADGDLLDSLGVDAAEDLADDALTAVPELSPAGVDLTRKQRRIMTNVDRLVDESLRLKDTAGGVDALSRSYLFAESSDAGAMAYLLNRTANLVDVDDVTKRSMMADVIYGGMGDQGAISRLAAQGKEAGLIKLELDALTQPNWQNAYLDLKHDPRLTWDQRVALGEKDAGAETQLKLMRDDVVREFDAYHRVIDQGTLGFGADAWAARTVTDKMRPSMAREIPLTRAPAIDDHIRYAKVIKTLGTNRPGLRPMHMVAGRHMTGVLHLGADDAATQFNATLDVAARAFRGDRHINQALGEFRDRFVASRGALDVGVARGDRHQVVREFETYMMERLAAKYGQGDQVRTAHVRALINEVRGFRAADVRSMTRGFRMAVKRLDEGDYTHATFDEDGIWVYDDQLTKAFGASQEQDVVGVQDWHRMDKFLQQYGRTGLNKWIRQTGSTGWQLTDAGLSIINNVWKTTALMRPIGYLVRNQIDTQLRLAAHLFGRRYLETAFHGIKNFAQTGGRWTTAGEAAAAGDRVAAAWAQHFAQKEISRLEALRDAGLDLGDVAQRPRPGGGQTIRAELADAFDESGVGVLPDEEAIARVRAAADEIGMPIEKGDMPDLSLEEFAEAYDSWASRARYADDGSGRTNASWRQQYAAARERLTTAEKILAKSWDEQKAEYAELTAEEVWQGWVRTTRQDRVKLRDTDFAQRLGKSTYVDRVSGEVHLGPADDVYLSMDAFRRNIMRETAAAQGNIDGLIAGAADFTLRQARASRSADLLEATAKNDAEWTTAYLNEANKHLRNSQVAQRIIGGETDAEVTRWLTRDPDGREFWRVIDKDHAGDKTWASPEEYVYYLREHVDAMLPSDNMRVAISQRDLTAADVRREWPKHDRRPKVPAFQQGELMPMGAWDVIGTAGDRFRNWFFNWASSMPEARMGRHPFYQAAFKDSMERMWATTGTNADEATVAQLNALRKRADVEARREVGRYMFDTAQQSNLGYHLRFLMPFYSAWEDGITKWARLLSERPVLVPMAMQASKVPGNLFVVVDDDGNEIRADGTVVSNSGEVIGHNADPFAGTIIIPIPGMEHPTDPERGASIKIRRNALNVVLQGEPFWLPGAGPMMALPVNQLRLYVKPDLKYEVKDEKGNPTFTVDVGNWIQPFGVEDDPGVLGSNMFLPQWMKNLYQASTAAAGGNTSQDYVMNFNRFVAEIQTEVELGEREPMAMDALLKEAGKRSQNYWLLRALGSQAPLSTSPNSEFQWYVDTYRQYLTTYGQAEGDEKFVQDFPEYFNLTYSLSANNTGINAVPEGMSEARKYDRYFNTNDTMQYGYLFAGAGNLNGEWDQATYAQQKALSAGPYNTEKYRDVENIGEPLVRTQVDQGWREYREFQAALDLKLEDEGARLGLVDEQGNPRPVTLRSNAGAPFKQLKAEFVEDLKRRNTSWGQDWDDGFSSDRPVQMLNYMAPILRERADLASREDMVALQQYMEIREVVRLVLDSRGLSNINSEGAEDVAAAWDAFTASLIAENFVFEQNMWLRAGLAEDDIRQGVTG